MNEQSESYAAELRLVSKSDLANELQRREQKGTYDCHQANILMPQAEYLFRVRIGDDLVFRNLIPCTPVVMDGESPRTLGSIFERIYQSFNSLDGLIAAHPCKKREWYETIRNLYEQFSWALVGPLFIAPVKGRRRAGISGGEHGQDELAESPSASFIILSGLHCSLAAMFHMRERNAAYEPVDAVLVLPRIDY